MSLFDVLSGRRYRFNKLLDAVRDSVVSQIRPTVDEIARRYELNQEMERHVRDLLYAYYLSGTIALQNEAAEGIEKFRAPIQCLSIENYKRILSSMHVSHSVLRIHANQGNREVVRVHAIQIESACKIYRRAQTYSNDWIAVDRWLNESETSLFPRVARRMYDDFASLINGESANPGEAIYWMQIASTVGRLAIASAKRPDWHRIVDAELRPY